MFGAIAHHSARAATDHAPPRRWGNDMESRGAPIEIPGNKNASVSRASKRQCGCSSAWCATPVCSSEVSRRLTTNTSARGFHSPYHSPQAICYVRKLVGVAGFDLRPPRPERGGGPAEFATILLPNYSVRGGTGQHQARAVASNSELIQTYRHRMVGDVITVAELRMRCSTG